MRPHDHTPIRRTGLRRGFAVAIMATLLLVSAGSISSAIPPDGPSPNTPGTSSSTSPSSVQPGDRITFTVRGFPAGETVYIKVNDGDQSVCSQAAVHGACVIHQQRISSDGTVSGSLTFPADLPPGTYWLRFLASEEIVQGGNVVGTKGYTLRGQDFTVVGAGGSGSGGSGGSGSGGSGGSGSGGGSGTGDSGSGSDDAADGTTEGDVLEIEGDAGADGFVPPPPFDTAEELTDGNAGNVTATQNGTSATLTVADADPGDQLYVYAYSEPTPLGWHDTDAERRLTVDLSTIEPGDHQLAVLDGDGTLLGWTAVEIAGVAETADEGDGFPVVGVIVLSSTAVLAGALLVVWLLVRRRPAAPEAVGANDSAG